MSKTLFWGIFAFVVIILLVVLGSFPFNGLIDSHELEKFAKVDRDLRTLSLILVMDIADTGHWPSTPEEVETALSSTSLGSFDLESLMADPYSGDRLIIKCSPGMIRIYSVGRDRVDQGGTLDLTPSTQAVSPGDIVFKLSRSAEDKDIVNITHRGVAREVRISEIRTILGEEEEAVLNSL